MGRAVTVVVGLLALLYIGVAATLYVVQRQLLFRPDPAEVAPEAVGLSGVAVRRIETADGARLVAWFLPGPGRRLILYFHGTGGSLARRAWRVHQLSAFGSVLAIDYRGFGGSTGSPSEAGLGADAAAAYRHALAAGYAPADIVVLGESLGTGLAVRLAAEHPVGGVVLAAAYTSIRAVAAERYWMFPVRLGLRDPFDVAAEMGRVRAPVLLLHGTADGVIPLRFAQGLAAGAGPNLRLSVVPGGYHLVLDDAGAARTLADWLARLPDAPRAADALRP